MNHLTILCTIAGLAASGCIFVSDDDPPRGTLVIDWTVDGTKDPAECRFSDSDQLDVVISTFSGAFVAEYQQDCEAFETSIRLPPGSYVSDAVLLDFAGFDRTTAVTSSVEIFSGDVVVVPIDFPASSFF
jgi:hypothetical protein